MKFKVIWILAFVIISAIGCSQENKTRVEMSQPEEGFPEQGLQQEEKLEESASGEMLSGFSVSGYEKGGKKQWDLEGKSAEIGAEEIKLKDVTGKLYGKDVNMTIIADRGNLNRIDNSVHLEENVVATSDDGATLITDYLDWNPRDQKLSSDAPVWIKRGMMKAFGKGLIAQTELSLVELKKDVTVKMLLEAEEGKSIAHLPATVITCDGPLEVDYQNNLAVFNNNVKVKDKRGEILADKMEVYFITRADSSKQMPGMQGLGIKKVIATGNTEIRRGDNVTYSQKAVYEAATGKLILTGHPKLVIYSTEDFTQLMDSSKSEREQQEER